MKNVAKLVMLVAVALSASMAHAMTGAQLEKLCSFWNGSITEKGVTAATYGTGYNLATACQLYLDGWRDGVTGTMGANDKGVTGTYTFEKGVTGSQLVKVFTQYIANHPEEENKQAGDVVYHAITSSGLLTVVTEQK